MQLPPGFRFSIEDAPSREDLRYLNDVLDKMNEPFFAGAAFGRIGVFVRGGDDRIEAGLDGLIEAGWLFVNNLWVTETLRSRKVGTALLREAERIAVERGCHSAFLDTFSFQAPGFYQKLGYEIFATLDYPPRHKRHFLKRRLTEF
jgi:GNAT superfamily N-acetyltransferase